MSTPVYTAALVLRSIRRSCDDRIRMMTCCAHTEDEHHEVTVCQEQIHYPSEDYPCLCERMAGENVCTTCGHKRESHIVKRTCRPASGESCGCAAD